MSERDDRDDLGHEPEHDPLDRRFAPATRGSDPRGRTRRGTGTPDTSGTGVPRVRSHWALEEDTDWSGSLPPDEAGVERAERDDDSR